MANKKKNQKNETLLRKRAIESLRFQTHWGLERQGLSDAHPLHALADTEIDNIDGLNLTEDLLNIKKFVEGVKRFFDIAPVPGCGEFTHSVVALALGIAQIDGLDKAEMPLMTWEEQIKKKLLTITYPEEYRNRIMSWTKENGFYASTHFGHPVLKFKQLWVHIDRPKIVNKDTE